MQNPPQPFEASVSLATDPDPASRARALRAALDAIPELQTWLRTARQAAVQEMRDGGMSYGDIGKELGGISKARVQQILEGRTSGHHAGKAERPTPDGDRASRAADLD